MGVCIENCPKVCWYRKRFLFLHVKEIITLQKYAGNIQILWLLKMMVDDNADIILKRWKEYFDKDKRED